MIFMGLGLGLEGLGEAGTLILDLDVKIDISILLLDFWRCRKDILGEKLPTRVLFSLFLLEETVGFLAKHLADILWDLSER
jgi:hypothetical protein